jgi:hypothetical protein
MVSALAAIPRQIREIATLIINPATGRQIDEELVAIVFANEIRQTQINYDLMCSKVYWQEA